MSELVSIMLHLCRISRKGKAAKGTVEVKTFGIPVLNEDKVAKDFLYLPFTGLQFDRVVASVDGILHLTNAQKVEAYLRGLDVGQKSESIRNGSESSLLANRIFALGLSTDKDEAERLASKWIANIRFAADNDIEISVDTLLEKRAEVVAKLKADGVWTSKVDKLAPRLVDNRKVVEPVVSDSENDSDDDSELDDEQ